MFTRTHREGADHLVAAAAAPFGLMDDLISQGQAQGVDRSTTRGKVHAAPFRR